MANSSLVINVDVGETRVGLIQDGILGELYVERKRDRSPVGNVYLGKVTRVLPGMQAAFIDVGLDRAAFLHVEDLKPAPSDDDDKGGDDGNGNKGGKRRSGGRRKRASRSTPIRDLLKEGQEVVVQVSKGPISTKGARVTSHISLPGRYVVYLPQGDSVGVSKRIGGSKERARLKEAIESIKPPSGGVVVRTLAQGLTKKKLKADIGYLVKSWERCQETLEANKKSRKKKLKAPCLVHEEPDIVLRVARDMFNEDVDEIEVRSSKERRH